MENMTQEAYKRYKIILDIIKGDDIAENLLDSLIEKACNTSSRFKVQCSKFTEHKRSGACFSKSWYEKAHSAHEALLSALYAFNRYCIKEYEETPVGGIYSFDPVTIRDRVAVANWAIILIKSIFEHRKI